MFVKGADRTAVTAEPGITRKVLAYSEALMMCEIAFEAGAKASMHSHPHSQVTYVKSGRMRFTLGDETREVGEGDSVLIPPYAVHGVESLEATVLVDVFSPARWDFVTPDEK
ncbi:MAG TPA: cupin domain-containing protein [Candidatus Limnocylindria bacterium]|nr:cupin domain-containing protein [Candidatus Limnocylindria bacterium]